MNDTLSDGHSAWSKIKVSCLTLCSIPDAL